MTTPAALRSNGSLQAIEMCSKLVRTAPPTVLPVSVAEVKVNSCVEHPCDDDKIAAIIHEVTDAAEAYTGRSFMPQEWTVYANSWLSYFAIRQTPVISAEVKYTDTDSIEQMLDPSNYDVDNIAFPALISWSSSADIPALAKGYNTVRVVAQTGYADPASLPHAIKGALLLWASHRYENAEATSVIDLKLIPLGVKCYLDAYRVNF